MSTLPSVSIIMPVGYGTRYFPVALRSFLDQDYLGPLQIVFVDNSKESVEKDFMDIIEQYPATEETTYGDTYVYVRCDSMPVGALRNLGTHHADGEICITGDEDDWSSVDRVSQQVKRLLDSGKAMTGWHNILYFDTDTDKTYKYFYDPSCRPHPPYAMGTSQCYRKKWWEKHKFHEMGVEDFTFQKAAQDVRQLDSVDAGQLCVARAHKDSKCPPQFGKRQFPAVERSAFPPEFFEAIGSKVVKEVPPMAV